MSRKTFFLKSTGVEFLEKLKHKTIFLGDWCNRFNDIQLKKKKICEKNIWDNKKTLKKDYKYLEKIFNENIKYISSYLNRYHNVNYDNRYWAILISPWLIYYIPFQYFRWKTINKVIKRKKCIFISYDIKKYKTTPVDSLHFFNLAGQSEYFNYLHFKKIATYLSKKNKNLKVVKSKKYNKSKNILENEKKLLVEEKSNIGINAKHTLLKKFLIFIEKIFLFAAKKNKIILVDSFEKKSLFLINLLLSQFPHSFASIFDWGNQRKSLKDSSINIKKRQKINYKKIKKNNFQNYLSEVIAEDIPICFLEKYNFVKKFTEKLNIKPNLIVSGFKHYHDEIFKFWVAKCVFEFKTRFIIMAHGKAHQKNSGIFNFEENISDKKINWIKKNNKKELSFPKNILSNDIYDKKQKGSLLSFVHYSNTPYPVRIQAGTLSENSVKIDESFKKLYNNLDEKIKKKLKFFPNENFSKFQALKVKKIIDQKKIAEENSLNSYLPKSKLVICSYPQSALLESMLSGPTILICDYTEWEPIKEFTTIYSKMKKAKIFFDDPIKAANHINRNWNEIEMWWDSKKITRLKEDFLKANNFPINKGKFEKLKKWIDFFNSEKNLKRV